MYTYNIQYIIYIYAINTTYTTIIYIYIYIYLYIATCTCLLTYVNMYVIGVYIHYIYFILSPLTVMICYTISQLLYLYYPNGLWNRSSAIWGRWWLNHSKDPIDPRYFQLGMKYEQNCFYYPLLTKCYCHDKMSIAYMNMICEVLGMYIDTEYRWI